ncbi:LysR family transcriptional regulator [Halieaceae bacterium IMCC14734]|uniref:LysR family transcriptional regulator n=1 Tax=Candidatus Litorirhabdus singularis TaxID=2518993 RepID=A0ABT3TEV1_9GAMM|nr:LysR family transcriptional regulator [Candidatus Litorirhabdus singularis]MCX2980845.1 LysR family transcriptional regulator [Candidatus Litorirhabdus singularis]
MNLRAIDLNLLTVFDAVITEGNVTRAAEKIGMSQPAVSIAIARFRHIAKDELFERTGRGVKPTPRALQLAAPIRRALDMVSGALEQAAEFNVAASERTFNLVLGDYGELALLPRLIQSLQEHDSDIRLRTLSAAGMDLKKEMHFGNVDLHVWVTPMDDAELISQQAGTTEEVCLVRRDHPTVKNTLSLKQYAALEHLVFELPGGYGPSIIDRELWAHGLKRKHRVSVHSFFNVPRILSSTDLVCSMPMQIAKSFAEVHPLKIVKFPLERKLPVFFTWHSSNDNDPGHIWLREHLMDIHSRL